jgi:hypothetical protein
MPPISPRGKSGSGAQGTAAAQIATPGEFPGSARSITAPYTDSARGHDFEPERSAESSSSADAHEAPGEEAPDSDTDLGAILGAIDDEVQEIAAGARAGIMAEFAGRVAYARKHLPRHQVAAAVAAFKQARKAALALVKRNAAQERAGRKKAATMARRRPRVAKGGRKPRNHAPRGGTRPT